jgi:hypothetical protein
MTKALFIPATGEPRTITLPKENAHTVIHDLIGGWFDCVSLAHGAVTMYVHDEGLLIGLEPNVTATVLYGNPIAGDVLLVGTLNDKGESDGYDYDLPDLFFSADFFARTAVVNNEEANRAMLANMISKMDFTPKIVPMTDDDFNAWLGVK